MACAAVGRQRFIKQRWASQPDSDGWRKCQTSSDHPCCQHATRRRRRVPADLDGRCFNYFSTAHLAIQCKQRLRCFHCRALGHRSYACPVVNQLPQRRLVWRPTSSSMASGRSAHSQRSSPASWRPDVDNIAPSQRSSPASLELMGSMGPTFGRVVAATEPSAAHDADRGSGRRPWRWPRFRHHRDAGQSISVEPPEVTLMDDEAGGEAHAAPASEELATLPAYPASSTRVIAFLVRRRTSCML